MDRILNSFTRRSLAEVAQYQFSRGGSDVSGPTIRAMEAISQQWGSISSGWREIDRGVGLDGVPYSEIQAFAVDIETLLGGAGPAMRAPRTLRRHDGSLLAPEPVAAITPVAG